MKKFISGKFLICLFTVMLLLIPTGVSSAYTPADTDGKRADIVFVHDTHSHLNPFRTIQDDQDVILGGFAQIGALLNDIRSEHPDALFLDAGDFSMGTLVQTIFHQEAPELRTLGYLDCEVTTLGNHEFDYRSEGLAGALFAAAQSDDPVPAMVLCNIDWETMEADGLTEEQKLLKAAFDTYGMQDYVVVEKGDVRIAVFGIFGEDSLACAPTCVLSFQDASKAAAAVVQKIRETEDVDMIVCVSHSGTNENEKKSEDEILAKAVPEIDLIISGHTHTYLPEPIAHGNTYIVSCGEYGKNLGNLSMIQQPDGRWIMESYELIPITKDLPADAAVQEKIDGFMDIVDTDYLSRFDYTRSQVLAGNTISFSTSEELHTVHTEHTYGNLLSDALYDAVAKANDPDPHPVDVAIVPSGCVRDTFAVGDITVEDVFNAYSLGIGMDGVPGYPLISMYLTGAELKTGAEIDASISDFMPAARLYLRGIHMSYNPHRLLLNKVTDCYMIDENGNRTEIEDDKLYRVVCDLYSGQMLGAVTDVSYGILSIQPKFADGTPIERIEDAIILNNGEEMKAWVAIAQYLENLPDTDGDGIADIPETYASAQGRKIVEESKNPVDLIKNPNKYAAIIVAVVIIVIAIVITLLLFLRRLIKRLLRRGNTAKRKKRR